jgi:hypothetical protein
LSGLLDELGLPQHVFGQVGLSASHSMGYISELSKTNAASIYLLCNLNPLLSRIERIITLHQPQHML